MAAASLLSSSEAVEMPAVVIENYDSAEAETQGFNLILCGMVIMAMLGTIFGFCLGHWLSKAKSTSESKDTATQVGDKDFEAIRKKTDCDDSKATKGDVGELVQSGARIRRAAHRSGIVSPSEGLAHSTRQGGGYTALCKLYFTKSGDRYHTRMDCYGLRKAHEILERTPCKVCTGVEYEPAA